MQTSLRSDASVLTSTGHVARLWRFPVKSMLGQSADEISVDWIGVRGDRAFAVYDASGRAASGKPMDGFARIQDLLDFAAGYDADGELRIRFPDGREWRADDRGIDEALSSAIGQPVTLVQARESPHVDDSPVHLLTTASLAWLTATLPDAAVDERRFRPNMVLDMPGEGPIEQDWLGRHLRIGELELRITEPTPRCGMVSMAHADLPRDPRVLRCITQQADLNFGVYADVITPGRIRVGDTVELLVSEPT